MSRRREQIGELLASGMSRRAVAREFGLASPTVDYHAKRLAAPPTPVPAVDPALPEREDVVTQVGTRAAVEALLACGHSKLRVAEMLGISKSTVSYHARRLGYPVDERGARRYDWAAIQLFYDAGHSVAEAQARFGFSRETWNAAVRRGAVRACPSAIPLEELCVEGVTRGRTNLKRRLIAAGVLEERCKRCGLADWLGEPMSFQLHHRNGNRHDNRIENIELVCPNCHSQTENFAGRNRAARLRLVEGAG